MVNNPNNSSASENVGFKVIEKYNIKYEVRICNTNKEKYYMFIIVILKSRLDNGYLERKIPLH